MKTAILLNVLVWAIIVVALNAWAYPTQGGVSFGVGQFGYHWQYDNGESVQ